MAGDLPTILLSPRDSDLLHAEVRGATIEFLGWLTGMKPPTDKEAIPPEMRPAFNRMCQRLADAAVTVGETVLLKEHERAEALTARLATIERETRERCAKIADEEADRRMERSKCPLPGDGYIQPFEQSMVQAAHSILARNIAKSIRNSTDPARPSNQDEPASVPVPASALGWLFGETEDANGKWFHESKEEQAARGHPRPYWWRTHFRNLINASTLTSPDAEGK